LEAAEHRDSVHDAPTIFERTTKLRWPRVWLGERSASEVEFRRAAGPGDRGTGEWQAKVVEHLPDRWSLGDKREHLHLPAAALAPQHVRAIFALVVSR